MEVSKSNGISFWDLLLIVFIVLKLTGVISWSWWWVLSPLWVIVAVAFIVSLITVCTGRK